MKGKRVWGMIALAGLAAVLIVAGLFSVLRIYRHYRQDMLTYESRHMNSIVSSAARGLDWMLDGYSMQLGQLLDRREVELAEEEYAESGDSSLLHAVMLRPDVRRLDKEYILAVYDASGTILAKSELRFPAYADADERIGEDIFVREDENGEFYFVFRAVSDGGLTYELAVTVQKAFSYHAEASRVGRYGYLFLMDAGGRFFSYAGNGTIDTRNVKELLQEKGEIDEEVLQSLSQIHEVRPEDYFVYRYPWEAFSETGKAVEETLVVACPLTTGANALVMGAAISFGEFDSFLSGTLKDVAWVILMELAGTMLLFFVAAWIMVVSRRNSLELQAVRERADLMEEINREQQSLAHTERLQQLGVMTSGIVHEFNNMLTPIMSQSMLLLEDLADQEDSPQFESALDIYEASENARDILRRMSGMGKKDVGQFHVIDLGSLLRRIMNLAAMAKDPHIVQEIVVKEEPLYVNGNDQLLTQAFLNICINACQAMGNEGTLTILAEREIRSGHAYAHVEVGDTGPGIDPENLGSLFDQYFTTKGQQGTGLGLSICKKIIESHMGTISAANREEGGAVFTVRIPICDPAADDE